MTPVSPFKCLFLRRQQSCGRHTLVAAVAALAALCASAAPLAPKAYLDSVLADAQAQGRLDTDALRKAGGLVDAGGRVLAEIILEGSHTPDQVASQLSARGLEIAARLDWYGKGQMAVWALPTQLKDLSAVEGLRVIRLSEAPAARPSSTRRDRAARPAPPAIPRAEALAGTISQGVALMRADRAQAAGLDGRGITVGVIGNSFDRGGFGATTRAAGDVASGDLPGAANPNGYTQPVAVVSELPRFLTPLYGSDDGRALAQVVHDVAPAARLCFATGYNATLYAAAFEQLADKAGPCGADIIVEDVLYFSEPKFYDGAVAQAINRVAAQGVAVFTNPGSLPSIGAYQSEFRTVPNLAARRATGPVRLDLIPSNETEGGFHDFDPSDAGVDIAKLMDLNPGNNLVRLYWNDPSDVGAVTTDYDVYLFSEDGQTLLASLADRNTLTDRPYEFLQFAHPGRYQVVIARHDAATSEPVASVVHFESGTDVDSVRGGEYLSYDTPTLSGHQQAAGVITVGGIDWFQPYVPGYYTGTGPATNWFAPDGSRLAGPETRRKPDIAAPSCGNATFYGGDSREDADAAPNFCNVQPAAPHAAGVAALLVQQAGGSGSLSVDQVRSLLQRGATPRLRKPTEVRATASAGPVRLSLTGLGDDSQLSATSPETFRVGLQAPAGYSVESVTIDLAGANAQRVFLGTPTPGLYWDANRFPFTLGRLKGLSAADISASPLSLTPPFSTALTMSFAPNSFAGGDGFSFGVDRAEVATGSSGGGNWMAFLDGAQMRGVVVTPSGARQSFSVPLRSLPVGTGYSTRDGWGLIDAVNSLRLIP